MRGHPFVVAVEMAPAVEAEKGSFYHSATGQDFEGVLPLGFSGDLPQDPVGPLDTQAMRRSA